MWDQREQQGLGCGAGEDFTETGPRVAEKQKQNRNRHTGIENKLMVARGKGGRAKKVKGKRGKNS